MKQRERDSVVRIRVDTPPDGDINVDVPRHIQGSKFFRENWPHFQEALLEAAGFDAGSGRKQS